MTTNYELAPKIPSDYTNYLLAELEQIQKQLATLTDEIEKWTQTK
jgi:hypothetical protein